MEIINVKVPYNFKKRLNKNYLLALLANICIFIIAFTIASTYSMSPKINGVKEIYVEDLNLKYNFIKCEYHFEEDKWVLESKGSIENLAFTEYINPSFEFYFYDANDRYIGNCLITREKSFGAYEIWEYDTKVIFDKEHEPNGIIRVVKLYCQDHSNGAVIMTIVSGVLIVLMVVLIFVSWYIVRKKTLETYRYKFNNEKNEIFNKNQVIISKSIILKDNLTCFADFEKQTNIDLNTEEKIIYFPDYMNERIIKVSFSEILDYEIYGNEGQKSQGGFIANSRSSWIGGVSVNYTDNITKELNLIIRFTDYVVTNIIYPIVHNSLLKNGYIEKDSENFIECNTSLQNLISLLEVIKKENSKNENNN